MAPLSLPLCALNHLVRMTGHLSPAARLKPTTGPLTRTEQDPPGYKNNRPLFQVGQIMTSNRWREKKMEQKDL